MHYANDNDVFDTDPGHSNSKDALKVFGATLVGATIGYALDDTRFGRWFNTSPVIGAIFSLLKLAALFLALLYVYFVFKVW